jgi:hypothetical protein
LRIHVLKRGLFLFSPVDSQQEKTTEMAEAKNDGDDTGRMNVELLCALLGAASRQGTKSQDDARANRS